MRLAYAAAAALAIASFAVSAAEAQSRKPLRVIVEGRSWLDAGKVVPVGKYDKHLFAANTIPPLATGNISQRGAFENLPDRFAGPNPFANSFFGPAGR